MLPILIFVISFAGVLSLTGLVDIIREGIVSSRGTVATPTNMELPTLTQEVHPSNPSPSPTNEASSTPEITSTYTPTPAYAMINAAYGGGASVRSEPGKGTVVASLSNGSIVQVFPEIESVENVIWVHIRISDGKDGWVLQGVLKATTLTPTPWPSFTSTFTPSRTISPTP